MKNKFLMLYLLIFMIPAFLYAADGGTKLLAERHIDRGTTCQDCHKTAKKPDLPAPVDSCLECHGGYEGMAKLTENKEPNPHDSHLGTLECLKCHHGHVQPENYCESCHSVEFNVP